ncbi:hypothetical protein [Haloglycomyces albus]|uniref:hypothetical protein n=1 Tax=Haloglycomyces albus TaxID=526067 RepID=UPI00046D2F74|nr:hypothetical protein [Haloglycomyces albus]
MTKAEPAVTSPPRAEIPQPQLRRDRWWIGPVLTVLGLTAWVAYATARVFYQGHYFVADYHYLTPFYSPCVSTGCVPESSLFGQFIPNHPLIPFAAISLPFLLLFRFTCYYYRRAYYRSFWISPPACAVPDGHASYSGESRFPLIGQNLHRYFFYAAFAIALINTADAVIAMQSPSGFGFGLGNIILWANVILLWCYTFGCHSCRHIMGGRINHFSRHPVRYRLWTIASALNTRHMFFAWITLLSLAVADFYVMAVAAGWISDLRLIG